MVQAAAPVTLQKLCGLDPASFQKRDELLSLNWSCAL